MIEVRGLTKHFGTTRAVDGVSFSIDASTSNSNVSVTGGDLTLSTITICETSV